MKKAVYLVQKIYPNTNGGTMHNIGLCRYLSRFVCLHVYTFTDDADAQYPAQPKDPFIIHTYKRPEDAGSFLWARFMLVEPVERQMLADVTEQIQKGDVKIVFFTIRMYLTARALRKRFPKLSFLYISHNCEYANVRADLRLYDRAHNVKGLLHMLKMFRANGFCLAEKNCIRMAERIFSISPSDSEQLSERYHADRERFITSKPMIPFSSDRTESGSLTFHHRLLIVGNMNWFPTASGALWFAEEVFPELLQADPQLQLFIVGASPTEELKDLGKKNPQVVITGFVDSVDEYYNSCDIAIVPVFEGTGAKIKVLEAVGRNIPAVVSEFAAKDYPELSHAFLTARDRDITDFAQKIRILMNSSEKRAEMTRRESADYRTYMLDSVPVREYLEKRNL